MVQTTSNTVFPFKSLYVVPAHQNGLRNNNPLSQPPGILNNHGHFYKRCRGEESRTCNLGDGQPSLSAAKLQIFKTIFSNQSYAKYAFKLRNMHLFPSFCNLLLLTI